MLILLLIITIFILSIDIVNLRNKLEKKEFEIDKLETEKRSLQKALTSHDVDFKNYLESKR